MGDTFHPRKCPPSHPVQPTCQPRPAGGPGSGSQVAPQLLGPRAWGGPALPTADCVRPQGGTSSYPDAASAPPAAQGEAGRGPGDGLGTRLEEVGLQGLREVRGGRRLRPAPVPAGWAARGARKVRLPCPPSGSPAGQRRALTWPSRGSKGVQKRAQPGKDPGLQGSEGPKVGGDPGRPGGWGTVTAGSEGGGLHSQGLDPSPEPGRRLEVE